MILRLAAYVIRRKINYLPEVIYQSLSVPSDKLDNIDPERVLHADRHFPTVKVFLYMEDVSTEEGPFIFCLQSHKMTRERLRHEYDLSCRQALLKRGRIDKIHNDFIELGRNALSPALKHSLNVHPIEGRKNTLVVANTSAFHARGQIFSGHTRRMIRVIFHYVNAPYVSQKLMSLFGIDPARAN